jgi:hypothetical protein
MVTQLELQWHHETKTKEQELFMSRNKNDILRIGIREDIHQEIKLLAMRRRVNNLPVCSISSLVGLALTTWLSDGAKELPREPKPRKSIQTTFTLDKSAKDCYLNVIMQRLINDPMRRSGMRLDREETDAILKDWLFNNNQELQPLALQECRHGCTDGVLVSDVEVCPETGKAIGSVVPCPDCGENK